MMVLFLGLLIGISVVFGLILVIFGLTKRLVMLVLFLFVPGFLNNVQDASTMAGVQPDARHWTFLRLYVPLTSASVDIFLQLFLAS